MLSITTIRLLIRNIVYRIYWGSCRIPPWAESFSTRKRWNKYGELVSSFSFTPFFLFFNKYVLFSELWGLGDYCRSKRKEFQDKGLLGRFGVTPVMLHENAKDDCISQKRKIHEEEDVALMRCAFLRSNYTTDSELPKTRLLKWTKQHHKKMPVYDTRRNDKLFCSVVTVDGRKYGSSFW